MTTQRVFRMTEAEYREACDEYVGRCLACGEERWQCEGDAREYPCENEGCGANQVYGIEELLVMGLVEIVEGD